LKQTASLEHILATTIDIETGEQGFVITSNQEFLDPFQSAVKRIGELTASLRTLTAHNLASTAQPRHTRNARQIEDGSLKQDRSGNEDRRIEGSGGNDSPGDRKAYDGSHPSTNRDNEIRSESTVLLPPKAFPVTLSACPAKPFAKTGSERFRKR